MLNDHLPPSIMRIQHLMRIHNIRILKNMRRFSIPLSLLNLLHNFLKRDPTQRKAGSPKNLTMEETKMHSRLHLNHRIEIDNRCETAEPACLQHPPTWAGETD